MTPAVFDQTTIDIGAGRFIFRATGSVQKFDGFLRLYRRDATRKPKRMTRLSARCRR
jgi:DNA topoisomerase-1